MTRIHLFATLLALAAGAFATASAVNEVLGEALAPLPAASVEAPPRAAPDVAPPRLDRLGPLFGVRDHPTPPERAEVPSALDVKLLGTLVSADAAWSFASVLVGPATRPMTVQVGDPLGDGEIVSIQRGKLVFERNGRLEVIEMSPAKGAVVATAVVAGPVRIRVAADGALELARGAIDDAMADLPRLAADQRFVPRREGIAVVAIRPGSLLTQLGIQNGDVIRRINGLEASRADDLIQIYGKLREWSRVDVEVERGGATVKKTFRIL